MIERLICLIGRYLSLIDIFSKQLIKPFLRTLVFWLKSSFVYQLFLKIFHLGEQFTFKTRFFPKGDFFAPWIIIPVYLFIYIYLAILSPIPILNIHAWLKGVSIFVFAIFLLSFTAWFFSREKIKLKVKGGYDYTLFLVGICVMCLNYFRIGIPLLRPIARYYYHNPYWMVGYLCFILGLSLLSSKSKRLEELLVFLGLGLLFNFPSGFRTDVLIATLVVLASGRRANILSMQSIFCIFAILTPLLMGVKMILISSADLFYIMVSRCGFTLYTLENIMANVGWFGAGGGRWFANLILQHLGVAVILIGAVAGELTVHLPRFYTSTFVGPLWLDMGIFGVIGASIFIGYVLGKLYACTDHIGRGLYSVLIGIMFIWVETGPLHYYFLTILFVSLGLILTSAQKI